MKRSILLFIFSFGLVFYTKANHITGGQIYYTLKGQSGNNYSYSVSLLLYRDSLSSGAQLDPRVSIAIYDRLSGDLAFRTNVDLSLPIEVLHLHAPGPCINHPPTVIYQVGHYNFNVTLAGNVNGYIIVFQRCCRIAGINNSVS